MKVLVTGGAGFVGSALVRWLIQETEHEVVNLDKLTYAGNLEAVAEVAEDPRYQFERADICDRPRLAGILARRQPDAILHLAAESHVDRSIDGPADFIQTNLIGTYTLLEAARDYWRKKQGEARSRFRFVHVSTDEVYGSLGSTGAFTEDSPYRPNSPYAATKAGADLLARAWHQTYGLPLVTTHASNCYGPCQFPEKLIPLVIHNALAGKPLPVYGKGDNIRDWLHVTDHARALVLAAERGTPGQTYNLGGGSEQNNLEVVRTICRLLDELAPQSEFVPHASLIKFVSDRPGHDHRYAIDSAKAERELGWRPQETFATGLRKTVQWYLAHPEWRERALAWYDWGRHSAAEQFSPA